MRAPLIVAAALAAAGLAAGASGARAEPLPLDEGGLRAVAAGAAAAPASPVNVNVTSSNPVTVTNDVNVANQVGAGVAVGVTAAIAAFSDNVAATGGAVSTVDLGLGPGGGTP